jgi:hypothetical protein
MNSIKIFTEGLQHVLSLTLHYHSLSAIGDFICFWKVKIFAHPD